MRRWLVEYRRAYVDCSDWLAGWCLPWRWVIDLSHSLVGFRRDPPWES